MWECVWGTGRGHKAASNLSQRAAICLGLSPVWEPRARERVAQTGLAPEKFRGIDGAGLRSQSIAPLGEVELVPSAGRGGWQCLGQTHCQSSCPSGIAGEDGVGWRGLWYFLVMGALMPCAPLAKALRRGSQLTRFGLERQLLFLQRWGASALP